MRRSLLPLWPLLLLVACTKKEELPDARQAAVKLEVAFTFNAGCIVVQARDKDAPDRTDREQFEVLGREASTRKLVISVFRREEWGRTLELISTAHEQSCTGPEVARDTRTVTLDAAGVQDVAVTLSAMDEDDDGFVSTVGGGTDCADNDAAVVQRRFYRDGDGDTYGAGEVVLGCTAPAQHVVRDGDCDDTTSSRSPGVAELCDGVDNDCTAGVDNGLTLGDFYRDVDGDGVGAGTVVKACVAPANHVVSSNDCDDADGARRPGLAETCDDKDNDCDGATDEGLAVNRYYRDGDGDGFGRASDSRQKCNQPEGYVVSNTDCDDSVGAVNPNAQEVCNEVDDNCRNGTDEGFNKTWHRDGDGDGFGLQANTVTNCTRPTGYVAPTARFDCNDGVSAVNPGAVELCNEIDDNCVGGVDEPFTSGTTRKGATCGTAPCTGTYVCNMARDATTCNAPASTNYYADADGDDDGATTATAQVVCAGQPVPPNTALRNTDCNDGDRHNKGNGTEVCDQRDNDCDTTADEGNVCMGAGWRELTDPAVIGRDWNTVAISKVSTTGYPVWIAGAGGALARRSSASGTFTSFDAACGTTTWNAAWVHSDGSVFLAGSGGSVARYDGTTCTQQLTLTDANNATGIVGFEESGTLLYVVDEGGHLHSWTSGSAPVVVDDNSTVYRDVHGFDSTRLFIAAQEGMGNQSPRLETYTGGTNTSNMAIPGSNSSSIRSVWMVSPGIAYAVGDNSIVASWQGADWAAVTPPGTVNFTSVCAPDRASVYVTDAVGVIRRLSVNGWQTLFTASPVGALRDLALVTPSSIWAVGPNGRVIHFPELP